MQFGLGRETQVNRSNRRLQTFDYVVERRIYKSNYISLTELAAEAARQHNIDKAINHSFSYLHKCHSAVVL